MHICALKSIDKFSSQACTVILLLLGIMITMTSSAYCICLFFMPHSYAICECLRYSFLTSFLIDYISIGVADLYLLTKYLSLCSFLLRSISLSEILSFSKSSLREAAVVVVIIITICAVSLLLHAHLAQMNKRMKTKLKSNKTKQKSFTSLHSIT